MGLVKYTAVLFAGFVMGAAFAHHQTEKRMSKEFDAEVVQIESMYKDRIKRAEEEHPDVTAYKNYVAGSDYISPLKDINSPDDVAFNGPSSNIIPKAEFGILDYEIMTLEILDDGTVENTYGDFVDDADVLIGIDIENLFDADDQTSAFVRNDASKTYFEIIREV